MVAWHECRHSVAELERLLSAVTAIVTNMHRLGGMFALALQVDDGMAAVDRLSSWVQWCSRQLALHECAGASLWASDLPVGIPSPAMSTCGSFSLGMQQQQQHSDVHVEVGGEQQHRCIVISGPGVQHCSNVQALLSRCGHRGFVLRSKLLLGRLWVQFRTHQQARRAHKDLAHLGCIMSSQVQCVIVPDSSWPRSCIQRGKPGGSRHRGHGRGSGDAHGFGGYGRPMPSRVVDSLSALGASHWVI